MVDYVGWLNGYVALLCELSAAWFWFMEVFGWVSLVVILFCFIDCVFGFLLGFIEFD